MLLSVTFDKIATLIWTFYWAHKFVAHWIRYSCVYFYLWPFRFVAVSVCGRFGLWPFRSVAVPVCGRFGLWPFRSVAVPVCGRFGLWPFRFVAVSVLAVSVCGRYDQNPLAHTLSSTCPSRVWVGNYTCMCCNGHNEYRFVKICSCINMGASNPAALFTNDFSIVIRIRWIFYSAIIQVVIKWSLQNFAHDTTVLLFWHVQRFVYDSLQRSSSKSNFLSNLNYDGKIDPLQWRHNGRDGVSNHQPHDCLLNGLFRRRSKKTSKLRVTGLCAGNSQATGEFPAQMASNAENVSIWWRHHVGFLPSDHYQFMHMTSSRAMNNSWL